eukprot:9884666-Ditylum_brightwellii.AAC.1
MLDDKMLCNLLHARADLERYQSAFGSTNATTSQYVYDNVDAEEKIEPPSTDNKNILFDWLHNGAVNGTLDLDAVTFSAIHARQSRGVNDEHLSKVWQIDIDTARQTI